MNPSLLDPLSLYCRGLSIRQIAVLTGRTKYEISVLVKGLRSRSEACRLRRPPRSKHWRTCRDMARRIWSRANGPIPKGYEIHHRDKDFTNNELSNLECLSEEAHRKIHRVVFGGKE